MANTEESKNLTGLKRYFNTITSNGRLNVCEVIVTKMILKLLTSIMHKV